MSDDQYTTKARQLVNDAYNELQMEGQRTPYSLPSDFYVVWFCKTLQNWKALVSTDLRDGLYWEVTHNGDKGETYVDTYSKIRNRKVAD